MSILYSLNILFCLAIDFKYFKKLDYIMSSHNSNIKINKKREEPPVCTSCGTHLTVKHILTECRSYEKERRELNLPDQLSELLSPVQSNLKVIIEFLHNTGLLSKI